MKETFSLNKVTTPSMADVVEKAKTFASDRAKAKGRCNLLRIFFFEKHD